ncbi:MAG: hypothetical protein CO129_07635 [Ignavibacteriales bacterium CG_4_9_14_3_um_filter_34_10]|nr:MAG: hypothetical protein CO129_07635 [Ignavibacteriales bacterium CG_4_9_14_3_um_filter_34_10]
MKHILRILLLCLLGFSNFLLAQTEPQCAAPQSGGSISLSQEGGIYLTAQGTLKVLVVFARFKDDWSYHPYWDPELLGEPPDDYNTFVDPNLQTGSTHYINLTNYFDKMSFGVYKVIGQAVYVEAPHNKSYYGSNYYLANKEILQQKVDPLVNFADFDNWSSSANYTHSNQPDGTVDMIIMIWRSSTTSWFFSSSWSGEASLGYGTSYSVEGGNKTIKANFGLNAGSGVTLHYWGERTPERNFKNAVHEMGHWLLGRYHPYGGGNDQHKVWGILTRGDDGICANTYERERLAWVNPTEVTSNILNCPFQDYVQYGAAYKYHPSNGATNEYFYFENHQKLNIYDNATNNVDDKGIFVIHQQGIYSNSNNIRVKTSNGQWDWQNTGTTTCFGGATVPKFKPVAVNRAGRSNKDLLLKSGGGSEWLFYLDDSGIADWPDNGCGGWLNGGGVNNSFNTTYNNVFSNYSNPWARRWTNDATNNFTMEIIAQNGSVVNAKFYITNPSDGKPSKPQGLTIGPNPGDGLVRLEWAANIDPDLSLYEVSRKLENCNCNWEVLGTTTNTYYVDEEMLYLPIYGLVTSIYRIMAKDTQGLFSLYSEKVSERTEPLKIRADNETENAITEYKLQQNYPNPFNPVTTIRYQLPTSGLVQLRIYDLLGREVAVLVNEIKSEGAYFVNFDASKLSSGIYIYSLRVNDFVQNNKMTLLK